MSKKSEQAEAVERLREWVKPGDTLYTILRHVSKSGMSRVVQVVKLTDGEPLFLGYNIALAIGLSYDDRREGVKVGGCGFDAGFDVVYNLGRVLFPGGFDCIGQGCGSNEHSNGDRDYTPHPHRDGGYALRQRWM